MSDCTPAEREAMLAYMRAEEQRHLYEAAKFSMTAARGYGAARDYAAFHRNEARVLREAILKLETAK